MDSYWRAIIVQSIGSGPGKIHFPEEFASHTLLCTVLEFLEPTFPPLPSFYCSVNVLYLRQQCFHYGVTQLRVPAEDIIKTLKVGERDKFAKIIKRRKQSTNIILSCKATVNLTLSHWK